MVSHDIYFYLMLSCSSPAFLCYIVLSHASLRICLISHVSSYYLILHNFLSFYALYVLLYWAISCYLLLSHVILCYLMGPNWTKRDHTRSHWTYETIWDHTGIMNLLNLAIILHMELNICLCSSQFSSFGVELCHKSTELKHFMPNILRFAATIWKCLDFRPEM